MPRRKSEPEQRPNPNVCLQITAPIPGLTPRWVGALLFPDKKVACNRAPDEEIRKILEHPECYRIVQGDDLISAVDAWVEPRRPSPSRPVKAPRASRPQHLRPVD